MLTNKTGGNLMDSKFQQKLLTAIRNLTEAIIRVEEAIRDTARTGGCNGN